jgi:S-adenosylmethionine decarboxylase
MSGCEWIIEAHGCEAAKLASLPDLKLLFQRLIEGINLHPVADTQWHQFPNTGGITGLCLLAESHIACHTFPEYRTLCLNVFCCRPREEWRFEADLIKHFNATSVEIRRLERAFEQQEQPA